MAKNEVKPPKDENQQQNVSKDQAVNTNFVLTHQFIKSSNYKNLLASEQAIELKKAPEIQVKVNYGVNKINDERFEVPLSIGVDGVIDDKKVFEYSIEYCGIFNCKDVDEKRLPLLLMIEAPYLLFPFIRRIVSDTIRDAGYPPVLLNPINFAELYRKQVKAAQEKAEQDKKNSG